jgi:hypothetical protein
MRKTRTGYLRLGIVLSIAWLLISQAIHLGISELSRAGPSNDQLVCVDLMFNSSSRYSLASLVHNPILSSAVTGRFRRSKEIESTVSGSAV